MGLSYEQLYESTPSEFKNRLNGWVQNERRKITEHWKRQRWHVFYMLGMMSNDFKSPQELLPLEGDPEKPEAAKMDPDKVDEVLKKWDKKPVTNGKVATLKDLTKKING